VFGGTPPRKPLDCKIRPDSFGALVCDRWAQPTGGEPRLSHAFFRFMPGDIIKTSFSFYSQCSAFRYQFLMHNKKPCLLAVSRVWKSFFFLTCSPSIYANWLRLLSTPKIARDQIHSPESGGYDESLVKLTPSAQPNLIWSKSSSNVRDV
jgi:hypothetical protein